MMDKRQEIIKYALAQKDKPYAEQGWGPVAWDCIGLFAMCGIQASVLDYDRNEEDEPLFRRYDSQANPILLYKALNKYAVKIKMPGKNEALPGDGLLFRYPKAQHFGVITRANPYYVIHASLSRMKVMHQRVINPFAIVCGWRYPGLVDG